ncbi:lysostaphin resistance A-like protein [Chitinophagaceae bacterium MMS25-I14]
MESTTTLSSQTGKLLAGCALLLFCLFAVTAFFSPLALHITGLKEADAGIFFISRLLYWLCLCIIWLYAVKAERAPLMLWKEKRYGFVFYLLSGAGILLTLIVSLLAMVIVLKLMGFSMASEKMAGMLTIFRAHPLLMVFTMLTAGIVEELTFRGYLMPRLELLFRSPVAAILLSSLLFGAMHYGYGNAYQVAGPFIIGLVFAIYYWRFRSIAVVICFHFLWDLVSVMLKMRGAA